MEFDARTAKLLPVGDHIKWADHPGLRLQSTPNKKNWLYRYKSPIDGKMRQVKIGSWPAVSYAKAVVEWETLRQRREDGEDVAVEKRAQRSAEKAAAAEVKIAKETPPYTVLDLCDDYYKGHVAINRAKKGATEIRRMFDTMLGDLATAPAAEVTRSKAFALIDSIRETAPVQAGKLRAELGAAWEYGHDSGKLAESVGNWWRAILRGKVRSKGKMINGERVGTAKRVLTEQEVGVLVRWLPNLSQLLQDVVVLYLWTATRGAEIVGMVGSEIADENGVLWWTVPKERTKNVRIENAVDLRVPLFGRGKQVVLRRKERYGDGFLFPLKVDGVNASMSQKTIQSSLFFFQPYCVTRPDFVRLRLPVAHWAPHDLRRTARTLLASLGCPWEVGEVILGHVLPGVIGTYNKYSYDKEKAFWLKRLSDHLEGLVAS